MGDMTAHFSRSEFSCKCGCGLSGIHLDLVKKLECVRERFGMPIRVTSGMRCRKHNKKIAGSSEYSAHLFGLAADLACTDSSTRHSLLPIVLDEFNRVGIAKDFIHVDLDWMKDRDVVWTY